MIDAYEIGIKLALQDDVTAGLAVIERELAEVDRAIAVTSASLTQLQHHAGAAASTAAISEASRQTNAHISVATTPADESSPVPGSYEAQSPALVAPALPTSTTAARPDTAVEPTPSEISSPLSVDRMQSDRRIVGDGAPPGRAISSEKGSMPAPVPVARTNTVDTRAAAPVPEVESVPPAGLFITMQRSPEQVLPPRPVARPSRALPVNVPRPSDQRPGQVFSSVQSTFPVHRSSPQAIRDVRDGGDQRVSPSFVSEPAIAPWSGIATSHPALQSTKMSEGAAAPQPPPREQQENGGGSVMLDGRLVGYWLSEQMARDAARPPSGTTFFDSRQTPAWATSGAI